MQGGLALALTKGGKSAASLREKKMTNKQIISEFLQTAYSDERLAMLLAHAEDGKLAFNSCCCIIGIPTADHALCGETEPYVAGSVDHYRKARSLLGADDAEWAFLQLSKQAKGAEVKFDDSKAQAAIIPLIKAEMERRSVKRGRVEHLYAEALCTP